MEEPDRGHGSVRMEHGEYPIAAPAAADLLEGTATRSPGYEAECVSPPGRPSCAEFTGGGPFSGDLVPEGVGCGGRRGAPGSGGAPGARGAVAGPDVTT